MVTIKDVAAEGILIAGGGCAILLQIANPRVGRGVAAHSDFASRPLDRLHATLTFVYAQAYGTTAERAYVARRVNVAHGPVRADASDKDPGYSAFDPQLQLWVAATLYRTGIRLYEMAFGTLANADSERIYAEYERLGTSLQMPAELWPASRAAFAEWWDESIADLEVTPEARRVAHDLLHPGSGPLWLRALMPLGRLLTGGLLEPRLREEFGLPWDAARERAFRVVIGAVRVVWPHLPRGIRRRPAIVYLRRLRREMALASASWAAPGANG